MQNKKIFSYAVLIFFISAVFFVLERRWAYYFLQDDNRTLFLPAFAHAWRTFSAHGALAQFNFHQFLGFPFFQESAIFYPPVYLAAWLSGAVSGGLYWTVDIMAWLHIALAGAGMLVFLEFLGVSGAAVFIGASAWALNGFVVYGGASWWFLSAYAWLLPWLFYFNCRLRKNLGAGPAILAAIVRAAAFFTGAQQYFVYLCIAEAVFMAAAVITDARQKRSRPATGGLAGILKRSKGLLAFYGLSLAATLFLILPLLLPTLELVMESARRSAQLGWGDFANLNLSLLGWTMGIFYPFAATDPSGWTHMSNLSHIGYVPLAFVFWGLWRKYIRKDNSAELLRGGAFGVMFVFCFLWALGVFNPVEFFVPALNRFRWHFKLLFFANFFLIVLSAFLADSFFKAGRFRFAPQLAVALHVLALFAVYGAGPRITLGTMADAPPFTEPLQSVLKQGRIVTLGFERGNTSNVASLGFDYATLFELNHFAGYDQLVPAANAKAVWDINYTASYNGDIGADMLAQLRQWGVRWHIVAPERRAKYLQLFSANEITLAYQDSRRFVYEDNKASPLAFGPGNAPLEVRFSGNSAYVNGIADACVTVNALYNRHFRAEGFTVAPDEAGRVILCAEKPAQTAELVYSNPLIKFGAAAGAAGFIAMSMVLLALGFAYGGRKQAN